MTNFTTISNNYFRVNPSRMLFSEETYRFMYAALAEAEKAFEEKEVPIGAVVVNNNRIIGRGYNQTEKLKDPTAHAEMLAITSAANTLGTKYLDECAIFVSVEPCLMCTGAIINSKIKTLYFAAFEPKFGACGSVYNIPEQNKFPSELEVYSGIYANESEQMLKNFFQKLRNESK